MTKLVEDLKQLVEIKAGIDFDEVPYYLRMAKELEAERDAAYNRGLERAAVLVREHGLFAEEHIRKEIDK